MENSIVTFRGVVYPAQCDAMGHLNVKEYMGFFDQAEWHCILELGFDPKNIAEQAIGWADVKHTIDYRHECKAGDLVKIVSSVTRVGSKSLSTRHVLYSAGNGTLCAELNAVTVQYDLKARQAIPILEPVRRNAQQRLGERGAAEP